MNFIFAVVCAACVGFCLSNLIERLTGDRGKWKVGLYFTLGILAAAVISHIQIPGLEQDELSVVWLAFAFAVILSTLYQWTLPKSRKYREMVQRRRTFIKPAKPGRASFLP